MRKPIRFDVISPDGFAIDREATYPTEEAAKKAFDEWAKRFEHQGYYSSTRGRIPLNELFNFCKIVKA